MAEPRAPGPPPKEALEWFRAKGLKIGFDWRDVWREEHAAAFTVAKIMRLDLLADVRAEVDRALAEGLTFRDFQKRLAPMLQEKGWWGVQDMADPQTGEVRQVQLGSPRRLRVIYDTNLRTARAAGQWARIQKTREGLPYLLYTVGPSREHRPEHLSWHGTLLPVDDPWWKTHFVPNGWGCKCRIRQISRREYERLKESGVPAPPSAATQDINPKTGLPTGRRIRATVPVKTTARKLSAVEWTNRRTGEVQQIPRGIDPGWDYNPGEGRLSHLQKLLAQKEQKWAIARPSERDASENLIARPQLRQRPGLFDLPPVSVVALTGREFDGGLTKPQLGMAADRLLRALQRGPGLLNRDTGWTLRINKTGRKKMGDNADLSAIELKAVAGLEALTRTAVLAETHADHAHQNEFVAAIHRLYAALEIDGKRYRVKLTVKEYTGATAGRNLHALAAVEIENAPPGTFPASADRAAVQPDQPTTGRKISIANLLAGATRADGSAFVPD
ncbi:MAG: phage minor head protein [Candidatus Competibacter sp.]